MEKKKFIVSYQYTIIATAEVFADSLEEAKDLVQSDAPCPEPENIPNDSDEIQNVKFRYLDNSCEVNE